MPKRSLKFTFLLNFLALTIISASAVYADNQGLSIGETIPNPEFLPVDRFDYGGLEPIRMHEYKEGKNMLVAFMPSISGRNTYANVMTTAFDTYFAESLAFIRGYNYAVAPGELKVLIVTNNSNEQVKEYMTKMNIDFDMVSDDKLDISHFFGVSSWDSENDGSLVYIVNADNKITYASYDYKGEGEKLKTVQKELFALYNIEDNSFTSGNEYPALIKGDDSRDFEFEYIYTGPPTAGLKTTEFGRLSDYIGQKNVIIAFYPAAYSYSCAMEVTKFDTYAVDKMLQNVITSNIGQGDDLEILMVSQSNSKILSKWKNEMGLKNVKLVSDYSGEISQKYSSFSSFGYNKRTLFLIDKSGKVSYIDWDYQVNDDDFATVEQQLKSLN